MASSYAPPSNDISGNPYSGTPPSDEFGNPMDYDYQVPLNGDDMTRIMAIMAIWAADMAIMDYGDMGGGYGDMAIWAADDGDYPSDEYGGSNGSIW